MKRLGQPPYVCLITEGRSNPENYSSEKPKIIRTVRDAISDGVSMIQIREKGLPARLLFDLVSEAVNCAKESDVLVVVNERADIALAAGADGVHLPEDSMPPEVLRRAFRSDLVIGVSTHRLDTARAAAARGADYVFFGPVFVTPGKGPPTGLDALENVCRELSRLPVIALGGIDDGNCTAVIEAGAAGVAAIRSVNAPDQRRRIVGAVASRGLR